MNTSLGIIEPFPIDEYVKHLNEEGIKTYKDMEGYYWRKNETAVVTRLPTFEQHTPLKKTLSSLLNKSKSLFAGYISPSEEESSLNTYWYKCNQPYSIEKLHSSTRRHIRRSLKELRFECVDWDVLRKHGFSAFKDTRERTGLSDGTPEVFEKRFSLFLENPGHHVLGAWKGTRMIAFMMLTVVDDWVEIGGFSTNDGLSLRPNNGLAHVVLEHFLKERRFRVISYGFSSIQEKSNAKGLHNFKLKCGFSASPVHRQFAYPKLLSPFINKFTLKSIRFALVVFPRNRLLKKGGGMLSWLIEKKIDLPD